ncbi:MAG: hypothetical protein FWG40_06045 [Peptococcaceae bacterium]|nr:hypothetical protein [Peptococcaceae bacterium]
MVLGFEVFGFEGPGFEVLGFVVFGFVVHGIVGTKVARNQVFCSDFCYSVCCGDYFWICFRCPHYDSGFSL